MKQPPAIRRRPARGFTLIEIVIVLAIIALLLGVAVTKLTGVMGGAKDISAKKQIEIFETALTAYQTKAYRYPSTEQGLRALVDRPTSGALPREWRRQLDEIPPDPWGHDYYYYFPGKKNGNSKPDVGSPGEDGVEGNEDDIGNWKPGA